MQLQGPSTQNHVRDWIVYSRRKNFQKKNATIVEGKDRLRRSDCGTVAEEGGQHAGQDVQVSGRAPLPNDGHNHNFDKGSAGVLDHIIPMCKRMGLAIEGRETELLAFLASLEVNKMVRNQVDD